MTLSKLASEIAKREGKKSQARIGDIREILKNVFDVFAENVDAFDLMDREIGKRLVKLEKKALKKQ